MNQSQNTMPKCALMHKVMEYCFACYDLALYLDTHPEDSDSIATYKKLCDEYQMYVKEYEKNYGPIEHRSSTCDSYWSWVAEKWPWEGGND